MKRNVTLKFVKKGEYLAEVKVNSGIRIPNIGEHYHYASGFKLDFLSAGSVVDIHTTCFPEGCNVDEKIVVVIDIIK